MRVGTRQAVQRPPLSYRDHPHACGDKWYDDTRAFFNQGSSPCVWGQVSDLTTDRAADGIIPMRVGTRQALTRRPAYN